LGQMTEESARCFLAYTSKGKHPPMTPWETHQLLVRWMFDHGYDLGESAVYAPEMTYSKIWSRFREVHPREQITENEITRAVKILEGMQSFTGEDPTMSDFYPTPFASGWESAIEEALARLKNEKEG
jgi:hypothetical protein